MKLSDLLIISLACGAPFGVFYFLQNRGAKNFRLVCLQSFCIVFVWIPYAALLLHDFVTNRRHRKSGKNSQSRKLENIQNEFAQILFKSGSRISIFELREIFERYIGLTLAKNSALELPSKTDEEIFRIALRRNIKLGATCLRRKNNFRINVHQNSARRDFINLINELKNSTDNHRLKDLALEFAQILNDSEASEQLQRIFIPGVQNSSAKIVQSTEDLWTSDNKPTSALGKIPPRLKSLTAIWKE